MTLSDDDVRALCTKFVARAQRYMRKAQEAVNPRDMVMCTAFASTLEWVARELAFEAQLTDFTAARTSTPDVEEARKAVDAARDAEDAKS